MKPPSQAAIEAHLDRLSEGLPESRDRAERVALRKERKRTLNDLHRVLRRVEVLLQRVSTAE